MCSRQSATAYRVAAGESGDGVETPIETRLLPPARIREEPGLAEMRELRRARSAPIGPGRFGRR